MINPRGRYRTNPDSSLYEIGQWMKKLSDNGGNYVRMWLSQAFWDIEDQAAGMHDILFAPFFSGAAGPGMCWHWDSYGDSNNLWYQYRRFTNAVSGIGPVTENFIPLTSITDRLRIYILKGKNTSK